jgi:ferrochelatase
MIGFGGPEKPEDIRPFLEQVTRGRRIPPERLEKVAHQYELIGGRSPLNELTFRQAQALRAKLKEQGHELPVYVGMRNWHPLLVDTVRQMSEDGVRHAVGLIMAPQQSDSGWEQYRRNIADAVSQAGVMLTVEYAPPLFDHPQFIEAVARRVSEGLTQIPQSNRRRAPMIFTAHSVPTSDEFSGRYVQQLNTSAELLVQQLQYPAWMLAYQSRSGRPQDPWLEPDIHDALRQLAVREVKYAVVVPIGFVCDHVEVLYDLDIQAAQTAQELGITLLRTKTVNDDDTFIEALADAVRRTIHGN